MTISVIVPVYNVAEYLPRCLDSLLAQTYTDIEIIAVDDGSTDGSGAIVDDYATRDSRIRPVHIANGGVSNARNVALDLVRGEYVGFVDSDDWIDADMYARLAAALTDDVDVVCGGYVLETEAGQEYDLRLENEPIIYERMTALKEVFSPIVPKRTVWVLCDKLFRKELVTNIRFDRAILNCEDMLFFYEAMRACHRFTLLPLYGYHYRMREDSMVHSRMTPGNITAWQAAMRLYQWVLAESPELVEPVTLLTLSTAISVGRLMLLLDPVRYADDIAVIQRFIRNRVGLAVLRAPSLRMRLGAIYLSLPLPIIRCLRVLTR